MSKIRVYELAKEAGMASKALADKLIDLGYDIKGHSSTVTEEVADDIRKSVLGITKVEIVEKRISVTGGRTVIRRRAETVRRRVPAPAPEPGPEAGEAEVEPEALSTGPQAAETAAAPEAPEPAATITEAEPATAAAPRADAGLEETKVPVPAQAEPVETPVEEGAPEVAAEASEPEAEKPVLKKIVPAKSRKGLAKVIKRAAIQLPVEESRPARAARPAKGPRAKGAPAGPVEPALQKNGFRQGPAPGTRGKKKGKRLVQIRPEPGLKGRKGAGLGGRRRGRGFNAYGGEDMGRLPGKKRGKKKAREEAAVAESKAIKRRIKVFETISVGDLAHRMGIKVNQVIVKLMGLGVMATMNQALDVDTATLVAADFGYEVEQVVTEEIHILNLEEREAGGEEQPRPPVVTVMGHVDHGKTSILDAIRKTDVAVGEAGGITQHIGAYYVRSGVGDVVFLDTPGHEAFTEMRSRGAQVTDVVVLVVAADDGVMDQTREAINHAQAAGVPIVVAVNKIDKANADPARVKRELAELDLVPEEWGGEVIYCETSAKQNVGIQELLENILLQSEVLELKADPKRKARGRVIEAQLHKGRGPVATVLVQEGTLHPGDPVVVGLYSGRVRALINDKGETVPEAGPSMPVEVQGLAGVPRAGDDFLVVTDDKMAKSVSASRQLKARETELASTNKISLDKLFEKMQQGDVKELRVVLRADVQGTLEAFGKAMEKLSTDAIKVVPLHEGTGTISESDVLLASASEAIIIGFNVRPNAKVKALAEQEKVDIRFYDVIYHALDDIRKAMTGMLEPTFKEKVIGSAEVREVFHAPKVGAIAGCYVVDGRIERNAAVRVLRDGVVIYTGRISSLRRFKDDAREVLTGYECGICVENFNDIKVGDVLEAFVMEEVASTL
ncbi:MAG: translation initiation factor IF-2 [Desulfobacterales bacterium]|nr:translation initiation factor IF-2 [Desulfobacterales bacterium]